MAYIKDLDYQKIAAAVDLVAQGACKRIDVSPGVKVYLVKNVVRVDLKISSETDRSASV